MTAPARSAILLAACLLLPVTTAFATHPPWWMRDSLKSSSPIARSAQGSRYGAASSTRLLADAGAALAVRGEDEPRDFTPEEALALGNELMTSGDAHGAASAYLAAARADGDFGAAWNNLGSLLRHRGHRKLAGRAIDRAIGLEPWNGLAWFNRALLEEADRNFPKADAAYLRALTLAPHLWNPDANPLIVGNDRALRALHREPLLRGASQGVTVDAGPASRPSGR